MFAAFLGRERDHVEIFLDFTNCVRKRTATMDQVEFGFTPSGFSCVAGKREFFTRYSSGNVQ